MQFKISYGCFFHNNERNIASHVKDKELSVGAAAAGPCVKC